MARAVPGWDRDTGLINASVLLEQFVGAFHRFDHMTVARNESFSGDIETLLVAPWSQWGGTEWQPRQSDSAPGVDSPSSAADPISTTIPSASISES